MTEKKELTDYDLDVINALKGFPQNKEEAVFYIRGGISPITQKTKTPFCYMVGTQNALCGSFIPPLMQNSILRGAILNAVINYLNSDIDMAKEFMKNVKTTNLKLL